MSSCCQSVFTAYTILEAIGASICEDRIGNQHDYTSRERHEVDLIAWYQIYGDKLKAESDPQLLMVLWHWTCMSNYVDFHVLELAIGKQGPMEASLNAPYVHGWASSVDAKRCLVHAYMLQKNFEEVLLRRVVAMHVPRCLFSTVILWTAYLKAVSSFPLDLTKEDTYDFPELKMLGIDFTHYWQNVIGFCNGSFSAIKAATVSTLADTLRQIGHWEICRKFSDILAPLIHEGTDDSMISS